MDTILRGLQLEQPLTLLKTTMLVLKHIYETAY